MWCCSHVCESSISIVKQRTSNLVWPHDSVNINITHGANCKCWICFNVEYTQSPSQKSYGISSVSSLEISSYYISIDIAHRHAAVHFEIYHVTVWIICFVNKVNKINENYNPFSRYHSIVSDAQVTTYCTMGRIILTIWMHRCIMGLAPSISLEKLITSVIFLSFLKHSFVVQMSIPTVF